MEERTSVYRGPSIRGMKADQVVGRISTHVGSMNRAGTAGLGTKIWKLHILLKHRIHGFSFRFTSSVRRFYGFCGSLFDTKRSVDECNSAHLGRLDLGVVGVHRPHLSSSPSVPPI